MAHDVQVRRATVADADGIAHVHHALFQPGWDSGSVTALMDNRAAFALVAETGEPRRFVGFVLANVIAGEAEILSIGVTPDWQRRGVAGHLMRELERFASEAGAQRVFLEVAEENRAALQLYSRQGFAEVGRRSRYYQRPGQAAVDAVVMARTLTD